MGLVLFFLKEATRPEALHVNLNPRYPIDPITPEP